VAGVPVDLVVAAAQLFGLHAVRTAADTFPTVLRPRAGPQGRQPERKRLVLHRDGLAEPQPVPPLQASRVVHPAQHRLGRLRAVAAHQRVQRRADGTVPDSLDQPRELGGRLLLLVSPQPVAAVGVEAVAVRRRIPSRFVRQIEMKVEHLDEHPPVGLRIRGPHKVRVIVIGDIDPRRLGHRFGRQHRSKTTDHDEYKPFHGKLPFVPPLLFARHCRLAGRHRQPDASVEPRPTAPGWSVRFSVRALEFTLQRASAGLHTSACALLSPFSDVQMHFDIGSRP
jgi:hypothetical protein